MKLFAVGLVVVLNLAFGSGEVASILKVCSRSDPKLSQCITNVVDMIRPNIASGDYGPGRKAPGLDPYPIAQMKIDHGASFKCNLDDVVIEGVSKFEIKKIRQNIPEKGFNITVRLPTTFVHGKYDLNMNILLLQLTGKGPFNLTLENTLVNFKIRYFLEPKDGKEYFKFHPIDLRFKFDKAQFYLKNLFNGDPTLEQIGNQAINANPHILLEEVRPSMEAHLKKSLTAVANKVVENSTEQELLPP
uniref:Protein takeout n=2 Tax=Culex pipiens TaxID=7175 RepID=A0A8D8JSC3_CULPI